MQEAPCPGQLRCTVRISVGVGIGYIAGGKQDIAMQGLIEIESAALALGPGDRAEGFEPVPCEHGIAACRNAAAGGDPGAG